MVRKFTAPSGSISVRQYSDATNLSLSAYRPSFSSIQDIPEVQEQYFHFLKDLEKYAQLRRKCPTIYHGEELKNQLHANPYNTYVNNHRIVGTVTEMLYESGSPVNLLEITTDTGRVYNIID